MNHKRIPFLFLLLLVICSTCFAQYEEGRYDFWREDTKLTFDMFQGDTLTMMKYKDYNFKSVVSIGFWAVLDVPKKKKDWKVKKEQYYFSAAVDKTESCLFETNDLSLKHAQVLWDICELATRVSRNSLTKMVHQIDSLNSPINISHSINHGALNITYTTGLISMFYMTALNDGKEFGRDLTSLFIRDVIVPKSDSMYYVYRAQIDTLLNETKEFATSEQEINRFITNTPQTGYIMAPRLMGDMKRRGNIEY